MGEKKAIFIGATGQNVGKTTICLGLIAALRKRFPKLGFMKPIGQQHERVGNDLLVDKDVVLFKEYFQLPARYEDMSPVIFPRGFTRDYLDGKIKNGDLKSKILNAYRQIQADNDFTIVEGTGHIGVGSVVNMNNAICAQLLSLEAVLISNGGIGSAFDELALNKALCDQMGVQIRGVILNKVLDEKREMIISYITKALERWNIPLIGCIPFNLLLDTPSMEDFESLFKTTLFAGEKYHYRHFETIRLVATSVETFKELTFPNQLIVTPATREDIILALLERRQSDGSEPDHGLILTGRHPPTPAMITRLKKSNLPTLYAPVSSFEAMRMITSFTAKIRRGDTVKVKKAIQLVEDHLNISLIC